MLQVLLVSHVHKYSYMYMYLVSLREEVSLSFSHPLE